MFPMSTVLEFDTFSLTLTNFVEGLSRPQPKTWKNTFKTHFFFYFQHFSRASIAETWKITRETKKQIFYLFFACVVSQDGRDGQTTKVVTFSKKI